MGVSRGILRITMTPCRSPHSDYGTCGSTSEDEITLQTTKISNMSPQSWDGIIDGVNLGPDHFVDAPESFVNAPQSFVAPREPRLPLGTCPHCKMLFRNPMTLSCGHSFCSECVAALLKQHKLMPSGQRRNRIRMGVSSLGLCRNMPSNGMTLCYLSPQCIVCGERPKMTSPVPNRELALFIQQWKILRLDEPQESKLPHLKRNTMMEPDLDNSSYCIEECKIAVLGSDGVGKTSLVRVQHCNDFLFRDMLPNGSEVVPKTTMIDLIDDTSDAVIWAADAFVLIYSICDRESFIKIQNIAQRIIGIRKTRIPFVLVGSKSDQWRKRKIEAFEGQSVARTLSCPFIEVSARTNDNVNQAFVELMRLVELDRKMN